MDSPKKKKFNPYLAQDTILRIMEKKYKINFSYIKYTYDCLFININNIIIAENIS